MIPWTSLAARAAEPTLQPEDLPRFPPREPSAALDSFEVRPGFHVELAAHEPEVVDPVALGFDERGRLFVVEMRDYSERRPERLGRVRLLEDRDADGRFESSTVFLDGLPWPTAIACWKGGVFIGATPDVIYARDTNDDGRADIHEVVFTGFASDFAPYATNKLNVQAMMNSFHWGLDCRIHGSASYSGGHVQRVDSEFTRQWRTGIDPAADAGGADQGSTAIDLRGRDFSFDPRTLAIRAESGGGQHGMSFDNAGRKFVCSNSDHLQWVRFEDRYVRRPASYPLPIAHISIAADGPAAEVFRISPEEPWRVIRTRWRVTGLASGPVEGGGRASGYFTGATGVTVYRGDAFGPSTAGDAFIADCGSNLIHRKKLRYRGVEPVGERASDEQHREFLASRDTWFRPVQFANAPDGCLWVLDMYREIIEHPWSLPPNLKRHLDLDSGNDRGRLYRIVADGITPRRSVNLAALSTPELVETLDHPNGWHRDTAARLLCERRDPQAVDLLREALRHAPAPLGRLHALHVLQALGSLTEADLEISMADASADVRRHAVRLAELTFQDNPLPSALATRCASLVADDPEVRLQLALTLGSIRHPQRLDLIERLIRSAIGHDGEEEIVDAALAGANDATLSLFERFAAASGAGRNGDILGHLAGMLGRRDRPEETAAVAAILAGMRDRSEAIRAAAPWVEALREAGRDLRMADPSGKLSGLEAAARSLVSRAASRSDPDDLQRDAVRFLAESPGASAREALLEVLQTGRSSIVQESAVEGLLRRDGVNAFGQIVERWSGITPDARQAAISRVLRRADGVEGLVAALEQRRIHQEDLTASQVATLRGSKDRDLQRRIEACLGPAPGSRAEAVAAALPVLDLHGDRRRGFAVFEAQCLPCHRLGGKGTTVGPDLESVRSQPPDKLLLAIVDPSREVAPKYLAVTVDTTDDEMLTGIVAADTPEAVILRLANGIEMRVPRTKIRELIAGGRSLMPDGFETTLTAQQFADLLACLTQGPPPH